MLSSEGFYLMPNDEIWTKIRDLMLYKIKVKYFDKEE